MFALSKSIFSRTVRSWVKEFKEETKISMDGRGARSKTVKYLNFDIFVFSKLVYGK